MNRFWWIASVVAFLSTALEAQQGPSFDCARASSPVQEMICADEALSALDRDLAEVWSRALPRLPDGETDAARAFQRGWIKGRDECWEADDVQACVRDAYATRITELQVAGALVEVPDYDAFQCESGDLLWATFYSNTRVPVAVLTLNGEEQILAYRSRTASGARYEGRNVSYWEHQGEVTLSWMGDETLCHPAGEAQAEISGDDVCAGLPDTAALVVVRNPLAGDRVTGSLTVEGCSRTFESNVVWRLLQRDGSAAREGFTSGGGVEGAAAFSFDIDLQGLEPGLYHLEVGEPVVSEEEGFPPPRTVLPLVVTGS